MSSTLVLDRLPALQDTIRHGELVTKPFDEVDRQPEPRVPGGQIQHWYGAMFLKGATVSQARAALTDYEHYKQFYAPEVTDSRLVSRQGDDYDAYLQLEKRYIVTVILKTTYHIQYRSPNPNSLSVRSVSTRITEGDKPPGEDQGFLWRLNSYWRFRQSPEGLWAECEAISLSRNTPLGLQAILSGFINKFPRESMANTLAGTQRAIRARMP